MSVLLNLLFFWFEVSDGLLIRTFRPSEIINSVLLLVV
ncbi:hypothetical protein NEIFL0001_1092 [Neisseria flavescens SK114]|nr:hypothetical protein NEIFL0001_1092 [Neisseria flavescens SK114]